MENVTINDLDPAGQLSGDHQIEVDLGGTQSGKATLDDVKNYIGSPPAKAGETEAREGTDDEKFMTPLAARQAIDQFSGVPSAEFADLTLPVSGGSTDPMPFDGILALQKGATAANQFISFANLTNGMRTFAGIYAASGQLAAFMPVAAGDIVQIQYNAGQLQTYFRVYKLKSTQ